VKCAAFASSGEVEAALRVSGACARAAVVLRGQRAGGKRLVDYVAEYGETAIEFAELRQSCCANCPVH